MIAEKRSLAFRDSLRRDCQAHVFSFVSIDGDRSEYASTLRKAVQDGEFCGEFSIASPDFEFAHFDIGELEAVLWTMLEEAGAAPREREQLHAAITGVQNAKALFEAVRRALPLYPNVSKGKEWGTRLMQYAWDHPERNGQKRRLLEMVENALRSKTYNYQMTCTECVIDPTTGRTKRKT